MKEILEKLTAMDETAHAAESAERGIVPAVVENTGSSAREGGKLDSYDDGAARRNVRKGGVLDGSDDGATETGMYELGDEARHRGHSHGEDEGGRTCSAHSKICERSREGLSTSGDSEEGGPRRDDTLHPV